MNGIFGNKVKELREKKDLTQINLADMLDVTEKTIRGWESGEEMPKVTILPKLAKELGVSVDYLLSEETNVPDRMNDDKLSLQERCAKYDDLEIYNELKGKNLTNADHNNKNLLDYIIKYKSTRIILAMYNDGCLKRFALSKGSFETDLDVIHKLNRGRYKGIIDVIFNACILNENSRILNELKIETTVVVNAPFIIVGTRESYKMLMYGTLKELYQQPNCKEFMCKYITTKKTVERSKIDVFWLQGLYSLLSISVELNDFEYAKQLLVIFDGNNKLYKNKDYSGYSASQLDRVRINDQGVKSSSAMGGNFAQFTTVPKEIMQNALSKQQYDICEIMNKVNDGIGYKLDEFEIYKTKIVNDDSLSDIDKMIKQITYGGIVDVEKLVQIGDSKLYKEYIKLPSSNYEKGYDLIESENYSELVQFADKVGALGTIRTIKTFDRDKILSAWNADNKETLNKLGFRSIDPRYVDITKMKDDKERILFYKIINHEDQYFFERAIKCDPRNLNWALSAIAPDRFEIIKLLLDAGAVLLRHQDDGWGYEETVVDEIGTEILKKKIDEILGVK